MQELDDYYELKLGRNSAVVPKKDKKGQYSSRVALSTCSSCKPPWKAYKALFQLNISSHVSVRKDTMFSQRSAVDGLNHWHDPAQPVTPKQGRLCSDLATFCATPQASQTCSLAVVHEIQGWGSERPLVRLGMGSNASTATNTATPANGSTEKKKRSGARPGKKHM